MFEYSVYHQNKVVVKSTEIQHAINFLESNGISINKIDDLLDTDITSPYIFEVQECADFIHN